MAANHPHPHNIQTYGRIPAAVGIPHTIPEPPAGAYATPGRAMTGLLLLAALAADPAGGKPNRLAKESSPYLLQHGRDPVDWFPWGPEAFAKAKRDGKLVFLSCGFSACHWCHVMGRESFADAGVAAVLNEHFVCIKLDREERPDVDHVYLTALTVAGQRTGWPLNVFLTADGKPIGGGTYWPREDSTVGGRTVRGFKSVLRDVVEYHKKSPEKVAETADDLAARTRRALMLRPLAAVEPSKELVAAAADVLIDSFDPANGGFGPPVPVPGPKFPKAPSLALLESQAGGSKRAAEAVDVTLRKMAAGGIRDQLGGGFHRYSTDQAWTVPHFEKMLPDQGQLLERYAAAYARTRDPLFARVVRDTVGYLDRDMTSPDGAFYSSLDADAAGEEGRFYVWTADELAAALPDPADRELARKAFGLDGKPNFEGKAFVLTDRTGADEGKLAGVRTKLLAAREKRPRPARDTKVLTGWNGRAIAGLAAAGRALGDKTMTERAARAAGFLLKTVRTADGKLFHCYAAAPGETAKPRVPGYLDDYTDLVHGLLALHDATGEAHWLTAARELTDAMAKRFGDADAGGFFYTSAEHDALFARAKDQYDGVQPSGNSQAALNLVRLWRRTGDAGYRTVAERTFRAVGGHLKEEPGSLPTLAEAMAAYLEK
jgi:uncharacterized protein YyaL (SSP411 family)